MQPGGLRMWDRIGLILFIIIVTTFFITALAVTQVVVEPIRWIG